MRVHVVSDVHGNAEALASEALPVLPNVACIVAAAPGADQATRRLAELAAEVVRNL